METGLLLSMLAVLLLKGETAKPNFSLQCYKKTTSPDDDFICTWEPGIAVENCTLFYDAPGRPIAKLCTGKELSCQVFRDDLKAKIRTTLWVEVNMGNRTYRSHNLSVVLDNQVKYDAPEIKKMSQSSGVLTLWWEKLKNEEVINEIALRKQGDDLWQNKTFETTYKEHDQEVWMENLTQNDSYEVMIRRRPKGLDPFTWSDWSTIIKVPIEIYSQPKVVWKVGKLRNEFRLLTLRWEEPQKLASFGGVLYRVSTFLGPCSKRNKIYELNTTELSMNVTASAANLNITAINNVGESPTAHITVPAQHLNTCAKKLDLTLKLRKNFCLEWYSLGDGETRPASVKVLHGKNISEAFQKMEKGMKNLVRYHYFIHIRQRTIQLCPYYKKEGVPSGAPVNVTVLKTTDSFALLWWKPIPVSQQRGFLTHYVISVTRENKSYTEKVSWLQTNYTIQKLSAGTKYTVHIAGETSVGRGPNATLEIQTNLIRLPPKGLLTVEKVIIFVCAVVLCCAMLCSFALKRLKSKYLPDIPTPVIAETPSCTPADHKETLPVGEEVDIPILLHYKQDKSSEPEFQEERAMLEVCESPSQEQEDSECQSDSDTTDACNSALSPNYKRQTMNLPTLLEENKSYKNGLVFEIKTENTEERREL